MKENIINETIDWIFKLWPLMLVVFLGILHYRLFQLYYCYWDFSSIHKSISALLPIAGGIIVLININQNLAKLYNDTLCSMLLDYLKACPLCRRTGTKSVKGELIISQKKGSIAVAGSVQIDPSIENRLRITELRLDEYYSKMYEIKNELELKINIVDEKNNEKINETNKEVKQTKNNVKDLMIGRIDVQIFGFLLIVYGGICGLL